MLKDMISLVIGILHQVTINAVSNIQSRYRIGEDGKAGKKTFICVVWEWLLYACKYDIPIRLIDKTNNPDFVIN